MKSLKMYSLFTCLTYLCLSSYGQHEVYYKENKVEECLVKEITPAYIKGMKLNHSSDSYTIIPSDVLFIFNKAGNFLVIPGLFEDQQKAGRYVSTFLANRSDTINQTDKVITLNGRIISCTLISEKQRTLEYTLNDKKDSISRNEVALIIYKAGSHKLLVNTNKTFKVLQAIKDTYQEATFAYGAGNGQPVQPDSRGVSVGTAPQGADGAREKQPVTQEPPINQPASYTAIHAKNAQATIELDSTTRVLLANKAVMHIKELETYLKIISDKDLNTDQVKNAILQAQTLFINEDALIEVSSRNRSDIQLFKVPVYLNRLAFIKYKRIIIEWYNIQYASKFRLNPDGTYTAIIELQQKFTGISDDKKMYEDITRKTVEVFVKSFIKQKAGETVQEWNVFLGNIGISVGEAQ